VQPPEKVDEGILDQIRKEVVRIDFVDKAPILSSLVGLTPTLVARNRTLARVNLDQTYDLTLAESEHALPIFDNPTLRTKQKVLRMHNNEIKYMMEIAHTEEKPLWKGFFVLESMRYRWLAGRVPVKVDAMWFISEKERELFVRKYPSSRVTTAWLPPSLQSDVKPAVRSEPSHRVLFVGGLKNPLNREGVRWYLKEVHPRLLADPEYSMVIAGSAMGSQEADQLVLAARELERCSVYADLDDLGPLYDECAVIVNPMRQGSGVKLKTVHAIQQGIPLVTTSVGAEGAGFQDLKHIRVADEPQGFAAAIREILQNPSEARAMADLAYAHLSETYDSDKNIGQLLATLETCGI